MAFSSESNGRAVPVKLRPSLPVILATAFGGEVTVEHHEVTVFLDRFLERLMIFALWGKASRPEILRERFAGDGHAITVQ